LILTGKAAGDGRLASGLREGRAGLQLDVEGCFSNDDARLLLSELVRDLAMDCVVI